MKILLVCNAGLSTSLVVEKMKKASKKQNQDHEIWAMDFDSLNSQIVADAILIGPQIAYLKNEVIKSVNGKIPVEIIDQINYGMCNGEKILDQALALAEGEK